MLFFIFRRFSPQLTLVVFYWNRNISKFTHVSRTLLSILADSNNAVVWMVSILPLISSATRPLSKPLRTVPNALTVSVTVTPCLFGFFFFFVLWHGPSIWLSFCFLLISLCSSLKRQNLLDGKFSFLFFVFN